ncbi:MAG: hypothetical protein HQL11_05100, partial [Candidatus Omnitrophica bacterium]|nr:hypothetical protein [Candidatus Omnitrophota bacterium]
MKCMCLSDPAAYTVMAGGVAALAIGGAVLLQKTGAMAKIASVPAVVASHKRTAASIAAALLIIGGLVWMQNRADALPQLSMKRTAEGGYSLYLNGKPYMVKGLCYNPVPVGKDYEYDFFSDPSKPWIVDGKLMKSMGANAIRLYRVNHNPQAVKRLIHDMNRKFGIRTFAGHYLGFWDWPPANYASGSFRQGMTREVLTMVREYKDEGGIVGWILGNENNYSFDQNVRPWSDAEIDALDDPKARHDAMARVYYTFVNDLAKEIKKIDPVRPVIMGIGEVKSLDIAAEVTPDVDILGVIAYRGATFGNLFRQIKQTYDKPVLMIEYGADRFNAYTREEDEESQAKFVQLQWQDIERNSTVKTGEGNCIGGLLF